MYVIVVYDTQRENCVVLHKYLKRLLFWNQRSVFEGEIRESQVRELKNTLKKIRAQESHITVYEIDNSRLVKREEIGETEGNVGNII